MEIEKNCYDVEGPSLVFISNFEQHSIEAVSGEYQKIFINLAPNFVETVLQSRQLLSIFCNRPEGFVHVVPLSDFALPVEQLIDRLMEECNKKHPYWEEMCGLLLKNLLILVYRCSPAHFPTPSNNIKNIVWDIKKYIENNCGRPLTVAEISREFHISVFYLSHIFKKVTGYSPKQYMMQHRLTVARQMLLSTNEKIGDIAMQTGFGDASNFTRTFREITGMTPLEYRSRGGQTPY